MSSRYDHRAGRLRATLEQGPALSYLSPSTFRMVILPMPNSHEPGLTQRSQNPVHPASWQPGDLSPLPIWFRSDPRREPSADHSWLHGIPFGGQLQDGSAGQVFSCRYATLLGLQGDAFSPDPVSSLSNTDSRGILVLISCSPVVPAHFDFPPRHGQVERAAVLPKGVDNADIPAPGLRTPTRPRNDSRHCTGSRSRD